jgi:hypothetical protein
MKFLHAVKGIGYRIKKVNKNPTYLQPRISNSIPSVAGGKANILGGHSIGHSNKKMFI